MKVNIKATNLHLTSDIRSAINEKISTLDKFIPYVDGAVQAWVEVGIVSRHHHKGRIYRAEVNIHVPGRIVRAEAEEENLYTAINTVKDELQRELKKYKGRQEAQVKRGSIF